MSLEGLPTLIFWSDTKQFETLNNKDDQYTSGHFSDNLYDYLYESAILSRTPSNLFVVFRDTLEGRDNLAHIPRDTTVADFDYFVHETGDTCLQLVDLPFDPTFSYAMCALVLLSIYTRNWLVLLLAVCLQIVPRLPKTDSLLMVAYRYRMAGLALDPLQMYDALGTVWKR
jgi:hypothetical protein